MVATTTAKKINSVTARLRLWDSAKPSPQPPLPVPFDLARALETAREEERVCVARNVHDELGALLMALKITLKFASKPNTVSQRAIDSQWPDILGQIDDIMNRVGRISEHLRLTLVDKMGLQPAIESHVREFSTITRIPCTLNINIRGLPLQDEIGNEIFCVFQEALTNVARHAEATMIDVELGFADGQLKMQITDNGKGITRDKIVSRRSAGVAGMRERARRFGGDVHIDGRISKGTTLTFQIPATALL